MMPAAFTMVKLTVLLLTMACYDVGSVRTLRDALLVLQPEHGGSLSASYGSNKANVFKFLSWDNKLRYCSLHRIQCLVGCLKESMSSASSLHPRLLKIRKIFHAIIRVTKAANVIYMDADTVLTNASTNLFSKDFFSISVERGERLGLTLDLDYTYATKHNLLPGEERYQTGVIFLRSPSSTVRLLLQDWMRLSHVLEKETHQVYGRNGDINATSASLHEHGQYHSDQWLFNELIRRKPAYRSIVEIILPRHVFNAFPAYPDSYYMYTGPDSDATLSTAVRSVVEPSENLPRADIAAYWRHLGIPNGDEVKGESEIVHFAGIFGGSLAASGATDVMVLLLAVHGFVVRHLAFVQQLIVLDGVPSSTGQDGFKGMERGPPRTIGKLSKTCLDCSVVDNMKAGEILRSILQYTESCILKAFSVEIYAQDLQNVVAKQCLAEIQSQSMLLFINATRTVEQMRKLNKSVLSCC